MRYPTTKKRKKKASVKSGKKGKEAQGLCGVKQTPLQC